MTTHKTKGLLSLAAGILALGVVIGGCASNGCCGDCKDNAKAKEDAKLVKVVNSTCPIGDDPIDAAAHDASLTRQWRGQTVGFCCAGCLGPWDKMSDAERERALAAVMPSGR